MNDRCTPTTRIAGAPRRAAAMAGAALATLLALISCGDGHDRPDDADARAKQPAGAAPAGNERLILPGGLIDADLCDDPLAPDASAGVALALPRVELLSNDAGYRLVIEPEGGVVPRNRFFAMAIEVHPADGDAGALVLAVSGAMPQHEHGLNARPVVDPLENAEGSLRARAHGVLLHMPGRWELYFDITRAGITERAQFALDLP